MNQSKASHTPARMAATRNHQMRQTYLVTVMKYIREVFHPLPITWWVNVYFPWTRQAFVTMLTNRIKQKWPYAISKISRIKSCTCALLPLGRPSLRRPWGSLSSHRERTGVDGSICWGPTCQAAASPCQSWEDRKLWMIPGPRQWAIPSLQAFPAEVAVIMEHRQAISIVFSKFLIHRTHEHNNGCLMPLKFGVVCYIATVSECTSMKFDHCCSKNVFTGELGSCRISSARGYIRNSQGMGLVRSSRSHISPGLSNSLSWYIGDAKVVISVRPPMYRAVWSARKGELHLHINIRQEH